MTLQSAPRLFVSCIAIALPLVAGHLARASEPATPIEIRNRLPVSSELLFIAPAGTALRKGGVLAVFDPAPMVEETRRLETLLASAQAEEKNLQEQLAKTSADPDPQKAAREAEEALKTFSAHDALISGLSLQQALTETSSAYDQQLVRFNARDKLLKEGFIQKPEYDLEGSKMQSAKIAADLAKAKLDKFLNQEKPQKLAELEQKIEQAKAALKKAETQAASSKEQLTSRIAELSKRIGVLQSAIGAARENLAGVCLLAPSSGTFHLRSEESAPPVRAGMIVGPGEMIGNVQ